MNREYSDEHTYTIAGRVWRCKSPVGPNGIGCRHDLDEQENVVVMVSRNSEPIQGEKHARRYFDTFELRVHLRGRNSGFEIVLFEHHDGWDRSFEVAKATMASIETLLMAHQL